MSGDAATPADTVNEERLLDLLAEWEEKRQQGGDLRPESFCPDDPAMLRELRRRIGRRLRIGVMLEPAAPAAPDAAEALPEVDGYEVFGVLGHGGMGVVYKARQLSLGRVVALKMIQPGGAGPAALARFRVEAEASAALQHANAVQVYQTGEAGGRPFLALELVPGGSLADLLRGGPLAPRRTAELVALVAQAVQHAHEQGVVHRDLKPANVLLTNDGTPKVADFGLARLAGGDAITVTGAVMGTPSYMAPEQARGDRDVGPAADVWALGVVLYECLTGRPPFLGASTLDTLRQIGDHDPAAPSQVNPAVPRDLEVVCLKCLEKEPPRRYASAAGLAEDLRRYLDGEPVSARSATAFDDLARALRRSDLHPRFRDWGRILLILTPFPPLILLPIVALFGDREYFPYLVLGVSAVGALGARVVMFWTGREVLRVIPAVQRRQLRVVWASNSVVFLVLLFIVWWTTPADRPDRLLLVYSLWLAALSLGFFSLASQAGFLYYIGGLAVVLSVAAAILPHWAPLIVAVVASVILATIGVSLRRLRADG